MDEVEIFNGIILPDGTPVPFDIDAVHVEVSDIKIKNHPAFRPKGSKGLVATEFISAGEYIGSYGGITRYFNDDGEEDRNQWNPYQLTPDPNGNYYIDGERTGNVFRYCNDPKGLGEANAKFYQSDKKIKDYYVCDVYAIKDINPEIS